MTLAQLWTLLTDSLFADQNATPDQQDLKVENVEVLSEMVEGPAIIGFTIGEIGYSLTLARTE